MDDRNLDHGAGADAADGPDTGVIADLPPAPVLAREPAGPGFGLGPAAVDQRRPTPGWEVTLPFEPAEVRNVMAFCVRRLVKLDSANIQALNEALCVYEGANRTGPRALAAAGTIIDKYNKLNDLLEPLQVNGASVHDSTDFSWHRRPLVWVGMLLLVIGMAAEIGVQAPPALIGTDYVPGLVSALGYVGPMAWGALGATVFLIKTLSDKVADFAYEEKRLSGTGARIFLGAVFGLLIVKGFASQLDALPQIAVAFLAGLGTKAVYAAIEAVVNGMAGRLSGQGNGGGPTGTVTEGRQVVPGNVAGGT